jgi:uncharacterized membrane protein YkvA (DUF1232 family)
MVTSGEPPARTKAGGMKERVARYRAKIRERVQKLKWDVLALFLARRDPRVPRKARLAIVLAVGYFFSPVDLIPDFIPVIGQLDELVIVSALAAFAIRSIPSDVMDEYRARAKLVFGTRTPRLYAVAFILATVWVLLSLGFILLLVKLF